MDFVDFQGKRGKSTWFSMAPAPPPLWDTPNKTPEISGIFLWENKKQKYLSFSNSVKCKSFTELQYKYLVERLDFYLTKRYNPSIT
jgi:hypothetical protein